MRTESIKVFKFDELSEDAQENALNSVRYGHEFPWHSEYQESLSGFCDYLGISVPNWNHERGQVFHFTPDYDEWREVMRGRKLKELDRETMPTGFCADSDLFYSFCDTWQNTSDPVHAIESAFNSFFSAWQSDIDYSFSDEGITDIIGCNSWEFTEDGSIF